MLEVPAPVKVSNWVGLRPFSGRSTILRCSITCEMALSLVSTMAALAVTSTLSVTEPTCRITFDFNVVANLEHDPFLKVGFEAGRRDFEHISAGRQIGKAYRPVLSETATCVCCLSISVALTSAPGTTLPVASVT